MPSKTQNTKKMNCKHNYKIIETHQANKKGWLNNYIRKIFVLQCKECGLIIWRCVEI